MNQPSGSTQPPSTTTYRSIIGPPRRVEGRTLSTVPLSDVSRACAATDPVGRSHATRPSIRLTVMFGTESLITDAEVLASSIDRPEAFTAIFDRHHQAIYRYLWTRVGEAADDLAAEVFRVAFERRRRFDTSYRSAKPWLLGIAANLARAHHRSSARRRETEDRSATAQRFETGSDPEARLTDLAAAEPVAAVIRDLPERDREPLLLYAWADLAYDEVAAALNIPVGTVRSRIYRARDHVRERLEDAPMPPEAGGAGR